MRKQPPRTRALVERVDGRVLRRMTIYLPADMAQRLRTHCAARDVNVSDVVVDALAELLKRRSVL